MLANQEETNVMRHSRRLAAGQVKPSPRFSHYPKENQDEMFTDYFDWLTDWLANGFNLSNTYNFIL